MVVLGLLQGYMAFSLLAASLQASCSLLLVEVERTTKEKI